MPKRQCLCGKVKYTTSSPLVRMGQCHCDDCRKSTGTGHASNAFFEKKDVCIEGEISSYGSVADTNAKSHDISGQNVGYLIGVAAGTLDDRSCFKADAIVYNKRKPTWDVMDDSIPTFEEMPPTR